jgi:transmembrane sensor
MSDCASIRDRYFGRGTLDGGEPELEAHLAACEACRLAARGLPVVSAALAKLPPLEVRAPSFDAIAGAAAAAARRHRWRARLRRARPFFYTGFAVAAAAALVVAIFAARARTPAVGPGARLDATSGARSAVLESGARVRLDSGAVRVVAAPRGEERLLLEAGALSLEVPKLSLGRAVAVYTPDAEVRVHGTRFQVVRDSKGTLISVAEGLVEVRPSGGGRAPLFVGPGESATVEPPEAYRRDLRASALRSLGRGEFAAAKVPLELLLDGELTPEEQAEGQALLAWSLAGSGDRRGAVARYRQALALLPATQSPLWAENACAGLALLLEQEEPAEGAAAWSQYLRRFPRGVHASLARTRAASQPEP